MNIFEKLLMVHRFWRYRYNSEEKFDVDFLLKQRLLGKIAVDIGANKGIYTYYMSKKVGMHGKVIAFEPQPELGLFLSDLKQTFNLANVTIVNKALSDSSGTKILFREKPCSGGASFSKHDGCETIPVETITLDKYVHENGITDIRFIKCDVEGYEREVFLGGYETLKAHMPILLFECLHSHAQQGDVFSYLTQLNYNGFFFYQRNAIHFSQFAKYGYWKPERSHRNYIFMQDEEFQKMQITMRC
ncbi:MAG: FkbM family methyltransferase [Thermodesulfobacteriota bacterium]|nr:FkbM family methyltransferase [Thermodesulfobacteriota bacterium]